MAGPVSLPEGFTLDQQAPALPDGFVLDQKPQGFMANAMDFLKSIPGGMVNWAASAARGEQIESEQRASAFGQPNAGPEIPTGDAASQMIGLPTPQGPAGRFGRSVGEAFGNPASYMGPGGALLKAGGAALGGLGAQAGEETGLPGGRLVGALAGGAAAAKALGPKAAEAAIPTAAELKSAAKTGYNAANASDLKVAPSGVWEVAENARQELIRNGFDPGSKVFKLLDDAQAVPSSPDQFISAQTLGVFNKRLQRIAQETQPANGGMVKPTEDAAAATAALQHFKNFGENIPARDVMAGDAQAYSGALKDANANYAASQRLGNFDARTMRAENAANGNIATSLDNQLKSKSRQLLDNPKNTRGWSPEELQQLQLINDGSLLSNGMRQLGRGSNLGLNLFAAPFAAASGTLPYQMGMAGVATGLKKGAEMMTKSRVGTLQDMLAQRSPLYQQRANGLPPWSAMPLLGTLGRASVLGLQ